MYAGLAYAITARDGSGRAVCPEEGAVHDLDEVYMALSDFVGHDVAGSMFNDAIHSLYGGHYGEDAEEATITWEIRCVPLLHLV